MKIKQAYLSLVKRFPLAPIRNDEENEKALNIVAELMEHEETISSEAHAYLEVLVLLIKMYEASVTRPTPDMTPQETLRYLMDANGLSQVDLCKELELHKSHLSAFLKGERALSRKEVGLLSNRFHIDPLAFVADNFFGKAFKKIGA